MSPIKFIYVIIWLAFAIGFGEVLVNLNNEMRGAAVKAYMKEPISYKLFTEQLTNSK